MPTRMQKNEQEVTSLDGAPASFDTAGAGSASRSWDPYDVWLRRVKQPRDDRQPRRTEAMAARATAARAPSTVDTASHPQLVLPRLR